MPKISVIMNCLNGEKFVRQAIQSVYDQSFDDWEIIFWDNASTDTTPVIAKSFSDGRLRYFCSENTVPLGQARQWAFKQAEGDWVAILDHDDSLLPRRFERQLAALKQADYAFSYCGYNDIDEYGRLLRSVLPRHRSGNIFGELLSDFEINVASVLMRRDALNGLDMKAIATFQMAEDYYLYLSLAARGAVCVVPEILVTYRQVSGSWTERALSQHGMEFHATLDQLEREMPGITKKYFRSFATARARADYAQAKYLMQSGNVREAQFLLAKIRTVRPAFAALFLVSFCRPLWLLIHRRNLKARLTSLLLWGAARS